jgi:CheY-like chemotaxis protein
MVMLKMVESKNLKKILIVDDDGDWLNYLSDLLYHPGYPTILRTARSGEEALKRLEHVDLVISDLQMPLMSGWELLKKIKAKRPDLPVILQSSGSLREGSDLPLREAKADGILQKNELDQKLWPLVKRLLGRPS